MSLRNLFSKCESILRSRPRVFIFSDRELEILISQKAKLILRSRPRVFIFSDRELAQRFSRHSFVCAVLPFRTACFMNGNKKIFDGHLPVIPRPRFLHHGFRQPLALCMRKKNVESLSHPELEPFQKFTIPLENLQFHWKYVSL